MIQNNIVHRQACNVRILEFQIFKKMQLIIVLYLMTSHRFWGMELDLLCIIFCLLFCIGKLCIKLSVICIFPRKVVIENQEPMCHLNCSNYHSGWYGPCFRFRRKIILITVWCFICWAVFTLNQGLFSLLPYQQRRVWVHKKMWRDTT